MVKRNGCMWCRRHENCIYSVIKKQALILLRSRCSVHVQIAEAFQ
jgi:hypothetical protein